jgi:hypothetical protein
MAAKLRKAPPGRNIVGAAFVRAALVDRLGENGGGEVFGLVVDGRLGGEIFVSDAFAGAAQQARAGQHLRVGVDERRDFLLAVLRQDGQAGAELVELFLGFGDRVVEADEFGLGGAACEANERQVERRLTGGVQRANGDARGDGNAGEDVVGAGAGLVSPAH